MEPIQKHGETCAAIAGFPALLWEALERGRAIRKPEYHVYRQKALDGEMEYWARVIIFNNHQQGGKTYMFTAARTRSVTQAVQAVAYKALGHLRHEFQYLSEARATRFLP